MERAVELLDLKADARVIDFGAGKCSWLAKVADRWGARCIGIEPARVFADEARASHAALINQHRLELMECSAADFLNSRPDARFDAALCIGSSHAFGDYTKTLAALSRCLARGGVVIVGEGYWKKKPEPEYLKALGGAESEFTSHADNILAAIGQSWTPLWCSTVTDDEWDEYEWGYSRGIESFARANPTDPDIPDMLARSRSWRETYTRWGRDTLGFGVYVLRAP